MKREKDDEPAWVFAVMANTDPVEQRPHLHCTRCDERMVTSLPMKLQTYIEVTKGFSRAHAECKAPVAPEEKPLSTDAITTARQEFERIAAGNSVERT